jgi:uncharacterized protein (TIGR01777 family)
MKVLITGSSGLVGSALSSQLQTQGHTLYRLVRRPAKADKNEIYWNPETGSLDKSAMDGLGIEAVVHLAGENIAQRRWNETQKKKIRDSRVNGTRVLADALAHLSQPPKVLVSASAIGFYGSRGDEILTEESPPGAGFLAEVCREWEAAAAPAAKAGIRVVLLRSGVILSKDAGALKKMLLPFKLGMGGIIGNGRQYMSWIDLEDAVGAIHYALREEKLRGPVNNTAPQPVTNREFTRTLGRVLFRPTCFPIPASTARLVFGEMADEMLLAGARVKPAKLQAAGYQFQYPDLRSSFLHLLK